MLVQELHSNLELELRSHSLVLELRSHSLEQRHSSYCYAVCREAFRKCPSAIHRVLRSSLRPVLRSR